MPHHELYATPQAVLAGLIELTRNIRQYATMLLSVPPGAQGGFLQPPQGSHFGSEA